MRQKIIQRELNFLLCTVFFSLLPLLVYLILHYLFGVEIDKPDEYLGELFFVTIMISSTTIRDIFIVKLWEKHPSVFLIAFFTTLFFIVISAIIYGAITYRNMVVTSPVADTSGRLLIFSIIIAISSLVLGAIVQVWSELYELN